MKWKSAKKAGGISIGLMLAALLVGRAAADSPIQVFYNSSQVGSADTLSEAWDLKSDENTQYKLTGNAETGQTIFSNQNVVLTISSDDRSLERTIGTLTSDATTPQAFYVNAGSDLDLTLVDIQFAQNRAVYTDSGSDDDHTTGRGGAIYVRNGDININGENVYFLRNQSDVAGGAIYTYSGDIHVTCDITFDSNESKTSGGAIFAKKSNLHLNKKSIFKNNKAGEYGGAIYADEEIIAILGESTFTENSAVDCGGAIFAYSKGVTIAGTNTFDGNSVNVTGVVIGRHDTKNQGGGGGAVCAYNGGVSIKGNNTFTGNKVTTTVTSGKPYARGGAVLACIGDVTSTGVVKFENNETAAAGGAIAAGGNVTVSGESSFSGNVASTGGGGAIFARAYYDEGGGNVTISGKASFQNNQAGNQGGAIASTGADIGISISGETTFTNNFSKTTGGAIYANNGNVTFSGEATFTGNSTGTADTALGGAIYVGQGNVTFSGDGSSATFSGNKDNTGNNDIYLNTAGTKVLIRDGGTYSFGGGIVTRSKGNTSGVTLGEEGQTGTPDVTFTRGSVTKIGSLTLAGARLTLEGGTNTTFDVKNIVESGENVVRIRIP